MFSAVQGYNLHFLTSDIRALWRSGLSAKSDCSIRFYSKFSVKSGRRYERRRVIIDASNRLTFLHRLRPHNTAAPNIVRNYRFK